MDTGHWHLKINPHPIFLQMINHQCRIIHIWGKHYYLHFIVLSLSKWVLTLEHYYLYFIVLPLSIWVLSLEYYYLSFIVLPLFPWVLTLDMRGEIKEINLYVIKRRGWAVQCSVIIYFYLVTKPLYISNGPVRLSINCI